MIPEQNTVKNHYGNNNATTFDFDFLIESAEELLVIHTDLTGRQSTLRLGVDYSVNQVSNENGSYITFPLQQSLYGVLAWNTQNNKKEMLSISLNLPIEQQTEYDVSSNLNQTVLEKSFDYLTRICQIQERKINRSIKIPEGMDIDSNELSIALKNVSDISGNVISLSNNLPNIVSVASKINQIQAVSAAVNSISGIVNSIDNINVVSENVEEIDAVSNNLSDVVNLSHFMSNLQNIMQEIRLLPENLKVGLVWKEFSAEEWNNYDGYYTLTIQDMPAPIGVFKLSDSNKIFVNNVDMIVNNDNCVLVSFEPFNGTILGGARIVNTVEIQNGILQELSSVVISEITPNDLN